MYHSIESIMIIIVLIILQLVIYELFLKSIISTWGASKEEVLMPMAGDDKTLNISSTRAILINESKSEVWKWLIQLGADRGGFYSYDFIENAMGYKTRHQNLIKAEFKTIAVGDVIRGSIDESSSIIPYNFRVLLVEPEEMFVLDKWGTFLLKEVNKRQTRLIIRTQEAAGNNLWLKVFNYLIVPLHFIMERRTLMGIKERVEAGENIKLSRIKDIAWFAGIVLSGLLILLLIFFGKGTIDRFIMPCIFSGCWLVSLLLFRPTPICSMSLLLVIGVSTIAIL